MIGTLGDYGFLMMFMVMMYLFLYGNILHKKYLLGFSPVLGFPQGKILCVYYAWFTVLMLLLVMMHIYIYIYG